MDTCCYESTALQQPWTRSGEVAISIHCIYLTGANSRQTLPPRMFHLQGICSCPLHIKATGADNDVLCVQGSELLRLHPLRALSSLAHLVVCTSNLHHVRHPMPSSEERIEPLQKRYPRSAPTLNCLPNLGKPCTQVSHHALCSKLAILRHSLTSYDKSLQHLIQIFWLQRDHSRLNCSSTSASVRRWASHESCTLCKHHGI
mmetsp:Transcript_14916/g.33992  ORF Transcript_14916/g.33992 Transcript_14916/m.33992 type:complete len:202 (-) Transcript_14916:361-966(-)